MDQRRQCHTPQIHREAPRACQALGESRPRPRHTAAVRTQLWGPWSSGSRSVVPNWVATEHLGLCRGAAPQPTPDLLTEDLRVGPAVCPHAAQVAGAGWLDDGCSEGRGRKDRPPGRPRARQGLGEGTRVCGGGGGHPWERATTATQEPQPRECCEHGGGGDNATYSFKPLRQCGVDGKPPWNQKHTGSRPGAAAD